MGSAEGDQCILSGHWELEWNPHLRSKKEDSCFLWEVSKSFFKIWTQSYKLMSLWNSRSLIINHVWKTELLPYSKTCICKSWGLRTTYKCFSIDSKQHSSPHAPTLCLYKSDRFQDLLLWTCEPTDGTRPYRSYTGQGTNNFKKVMSENDVTFTFSLNVAITFQLQ